MGACKFMATSYGKNANEAFRSAVEVARYEYGNKGHTGSIAEKHSYRTVSLPKDEKPIDFVERLLYDESSKHWCLDKHGPAACVDTREVNIKGEKKFIFFGLASS